MFSPACGNLRTAATDTPHALSIHRNSPGRFGRRLTLAGFLAITQLIPVAPRLSAEPEFHPTAAAPDLEPAAPILGAGEELSFRVRWRVFDRAGTIEVAADDHTPVEKADTGDAFAGPSPTLRRIQVKIATDGTIARLYTYRAEGETFYDPINGRILSARFLSTAGGKQQERTLEFDRALGIARYRDARNPSRDEDLALPEGDPLDILTSLVTARHWKLAPGQTHDILLQADKRFYPLRLRAESRETLRAALGEFPALVVVPEPIGEARGLFRRGGSIRVWIEDSPRALPLKIEIETRAGRFVADLIRYQAPGVGSDSDQLLVEPDPSGSRAPGGHRSRRR